MIISLKGKLQHCFPNQDTTSLRAWYSNTLMIQAILSSIQSHNKNINFIQVETIEASLDDITAIDNAFRHGSPTFHCNRGLHCNALMVNVSESWLRGLRCNVLMVNEEFSLVSHAHWALIIQMTCQLPQTAAVLGVVAAVMTKTHQASVQSTAQP